MNLRTLAGAGDLRMQRPDLGNRVLIGIVAAIVLVLVAYFLLLPSLPQALRTPGSPVLYTVGALGACQLLVSMAFVLAKRTGRGGPPPAWFVAHVVASSLGTVLVAIHSAGYLRRPPALLFLALLGLILLGVWGRVWLSRRMSATFGTKHGHFAALTEDRRARLSAVIAQKVEILRALDPAAREGTFSPTLAHWFRRPRLTARYARLVREESRLIGTREMVSLQQAYWRAAHLALAYTFVAGLLTHVVTVTFFAGYVADGGEITWWHLAAW
jgi:hypothetical protein